MKIPFVGGSYIYPNTSFDAQASINVYPVFSESGTSKSDSFLRQVPGRILLQQIPKQSIRGMISTTTRAFLVAYDTFYEIFEDNTALSRGTLITSTSGNVSMAYNNNNQIMIVDGTPQSLPTLAGGYIFDTSTDTFTQITDTNFQGGTTVCFITEYFMVNRPNTAVYQISALPNDGGGLTWPANQQAASESEPGNLVSIAVLNQQGYLLGQNTIQVIYNNASADPTVFTFSNMQGAFTQYGCAGSFTSIAVNNQVLFIGLDAQGKGIVFAVTQYIPQRISNQSIELFLSKYDLTNATVLAYQEEGHYFVQWNIPTADKSIVYDMNTQLWHYRSRWNPNSAKWERDRANYHVYIWNKHIVGDYENGNIYQQSQSFYQDNDYLLRRVRFLSYLVDDLERIFINFAQLDCQVGVGSIGGSPWNEEPIVSLRWSDDGGNTYSKSHQRSLGLAGQYTHRVYWNRLGKTRYRIFMLETDAAVPINFIAFHVKLQLGRD